MPFKCPGQDSRKLKVEVIKCQNCGYEVEFFSDEIKRKCPKCKKDIFRENVPSCIEWCAYAEKCVGENYYRKYMEGKRELIKEKILNKVKKIMPEKINLIELILKFTEELVSKKERLPIIIPASILYFLSEKEKRDILREVDFKNEDIDKIIKLEKEDIEILNDALLLAKSQIGEKIEIEKFLTNKGKEIYLSKTK